MEIEQPTLLPPDDLVIGQTDGGNELTVSRCTIVAHNVAPDGKPNPIHEDDPYFVFLYQKGDAFFRVRGLNPEMMSGEQISAREADELLAKLAYRTG